MDEKVLKELEQEISGNPEYKEMQERLANFLKRYDVQMYDKDGVGLLQLFRYSKQYGIDFVETEVARLMESRPMASKKTKISMLPGKLTTVLMNMQKVTFVSIYEGPVFTYKPKGQPSTTTDMKGKPVVVLIDNELYTIIAKQSKIEMPFLPYHKYVGYGNFTKRGDDKMFYLNSTLPVTDLGESDLKVNLEEIMSIGRPTVYQYSDLVDLMTRNSQVTFFMKAYVERVDEKKNSRGAYLILPSGFDLPQDRPISLLVGNDISPEDELLIVGTINQQNTWNDEIQIAAKLILPVRDEYTQDDMDSPNTISQKPTITVEATNTPVPKTENTPTSSVAPDTPSKKEPSTSKTQPKIEDDDERINAILNNTMSDDEADKFFG